MNIVTLNSKAVHLWLERKMKGDRVVGDCGNTVRRFALTHDTVTCRACIAQRRKCLQAVVDTLEAAMKDPTR